MTTSISIVVTLKMPDMLGEEGDTMPEGWTKKVVMRQSGATGQSGRCDVYIFRCGHQVSILYT